MPIESRFDDLDLREEPESGKAENMDGTTSAVCTYTCTSHDTCSTKLC